MKEAEKSGKNVYSAAHIRAQAEPPSAAIDPRSAAGNIAVQELLQSGGMPMDASLRGRYERSFNSDFSAVHVHTDAHADAAARSVGASAFAFGNDIAFAHGGFDPSSPAGLSLLTHELTHVDQQARSISPVGIQRQRLGATTTTTSIPSRQTEVADPDFPFPTDAKVKADDTPFAVGNRTFEFAISAIDPTIFLVPQDASLDDVAARLLGDQKLDDEIDFVPLPDSDEQSGVRLRQYDHLNPDAYKLLIAALDKRVDEDSVWVKDKLCERIITESDQRALTKITLRWSQRSIIKDSSGTQYFDRFLSALDKWTLTSFWGTSQSAYDWLLDSVPSLRELVQKAVTLRSSRSVGYTVTDQQPDFKAGDTVGRFFYSKNFDPLPIKVWERVTVESSMEQAERVMRSGNSAYMRIVIPGKDGKFYGYTVHPKFRSSKGKYDNDWRPDPSTDPNGEYFWYYPGTLFINKNEFRMAFPVGGPEAPNQRRDLLTKALGQATKEDISSIANLDFEVLLTASFDERFRMINMVLDGQGKETEAGAGLLARIIFTTPNADFPAMERKMSTDGTIGRFLKLSKDFPGLALVGRAFTYRSVQAMPPSAEEISKIETLQLGLDSDDRLHFAFSETHKASSETIGPDRWDPKAAASIGHEPTRSSETPGRFEREVIRFYPTLLQSGGVLKLVSATFHDQHVIALPTTRDFLPTELVRIEVLGKRPEIRIVTALEAAGMLEFTTSDWMENVLKPFAKIWMWVPALRGLGFGLSGAIAEVTAMQAVKTFAWEAVVLGSMEVVDAYREELAETEAGRAFLAVYDLAMTALMARDLYKVLSSGVLVKLAEAGGKVFSSLKQATRLAIERSMAEIEALNLAWKRLEEAGELVTSEAGAATRVPKSPERFQQLWMAARAETYTARAVTRLLAAGESTVSAERLFKKLQAISDESAEMARAQRLLAERAAGLAGPQLENFLKAFENTLGNSRGLTHELSGWFQAAARTADPVAYLREVDKLIAKKGVAAVSIEVMGNKAAAGTLDIAWLNKTVLTQRDLSTLGSDPRTPWSAYQKAAASADEDTQFWARTSIRGASAEIVTERNARTILPDHTIRGAQVPMGDSIIDYEVTANGIGSRHGLEIKGWTKDTWKEALDLAKKRMTPPGTLTSTEGKTVAKLDHMIKQLKDAQAFTGKPPLLGLSSDVPAEQIKSLERLLRSEGLGGTQIVRLPESQILEMGRTLRKAMGIP